MGRMFCTAVPITLSDGQVSELTMKAEAAGRIINSDETHHNHRLSNQSDRGGSRANTQTDPGLLCLGANAQPLLCEVKPGFNATKMALGCSFPKKHEKQRKKHENYVRKWNNSQNRHIPK